MELKQLRMLFNAGALETAEAVKAPLQMKGWILHFTQKNSGIVLLGTAREPNNAKVFKSLDAAATAATEIGFSQIVVKTAEKQEQGDNPDDFELRAQ